MATVLKIPAKFHPITHLPETKVQKRRVAAYARVSTDSEEQQTSYAAQVDRYTKYRNGQTGSLLQSIPMRAFLP